MRISTLHFRGLKEAPFPKLFRTGGTSSVPNLDRVCTHVQLYSRVNCANLDWKPKMKMKSYSISNDARRRPAVITISACHQLRPRVQPAASPATQSSLTAPHAPRATHLQAETSNRRNLQLEMAVTPRNQTTGQIRIDTNFGSRRTLRAPQISNHESRITNHQSLITNHYKRHVCLPPPTLLK